MRKSLTFCVAAAAVMAVPFHARALDLTPDAARILSDPTYLPLAGQIYGYTAYDHGWTSGDTYNDMGAQNSSFRVNTDDILQSLAYGITDDLSVGANIRYEPSANRQIDFNSGGSTTLASSGFSDPAFAATWRVLDQRVDPASLDLFGSYTPDWIGAKTATATEDGTVARGGQSGTLGAALGYETRDFTIRGAVNANFYGSSDTLDLSNGAELQTGDYSDYVVSLATQTRLTDLFSINAGVDHTFASSENTVNTVDGISHVASPGDLTALRLALNYHIVQNTAVISATYAYESYGNGKTTFATPSFDTETRNKSGNLLGVRLDYALP